MNKMKSCRIGTIQMPVTGNKAEDLAFAVGQIRKVSGEKADIAVLPEMFDSPYDSSKFLEYSDRIGGETYRRLSDTAKECGIWLIAGSVPLLEDGKLYNASFVFDRDGKEAACHKKVHLFDIDVKGGQAFRESDTLTAGDHITVFDTEFGKIGLCICFDFRFPELSRVMTLQGARILVVPGAFNMTTGPAHWEILFRMRAVENQVYTVGVAPARGDSGYISYGNSMIVEPWGNVVYRADEKPETRVTEIDLDRIDDIRAQIPMISARRTDLYQLS